MICGLHAFFLGGSPLPISYPSPCVKIALFLREARVKGARGTLLSNVFENDIMVCMEILKKLDDRKGETKNGGRIKRI
jgi:hypothetical protein